MFHPCIQSSSALGWTQLYITQLLQLHELYSTVISLQTTISPQPLPQPSCLQQPWNALNRLSCNVYTELCCCYLRFRLQVNVSDMQLAAELAGTHIHTHSEHHTDICLPPCHFQRLWKDIQRFTSSEIRVTNTFMRPPLWQPPANISCCYCCCPLLCTVCCAVGQRQLHFLVWRHFCHIPVKLFGLVTNEFDWWWSIVFSIVSILSIYLYLFYLNFFRL